MIFTSTETLQKITTKVQNITALKKHKLKCKINKIRLINHTINGNKHTCIYEPFLPCPTFKATRLTVWFRYNMSMNYYTWVHQFTKEGEGR